MNIRADVTVVRKGDGVALLRKILSNLAGAKGTASVKVGFPAGQVPEKIIAYATYNHEGTSRGIEPRPFINVAMFRGRAKIVQAMRAEAKLIYSGKSTIDRSLRQLGDVGRDEIRAAISSNIGPPNSREWSNYKGFKRTLIYKGDMRRAVTWALE